MEHTLEIVKSFGWLIAILINLLIIWIAWSLRHKFVTREDCERFCAGHSKARERLNELLVSHAGEMKELKMRLSVMPDHGRLHELELKLARIEGDQGRIMAAMDGIRQILERVENQTTLLMRDRMGDDK